MRPETIFYPFITLIFVTFIVGFTLVYLRINAVKHSGLNPKHFLLNRGGKVPEYLVKVEQHYSNLFELPLLFYSLLILLYVTHQVDTLQVSLAWAFVVTRILHTLIHTTVNRLKWRLYAFITGAVILFYAWLSFAWQLLLA